MELVGTLLGGRYRIVRRLGQGGMGVVYEGVAEPLGRRVAVKVLSDELARDPEMAVRFAREARSAASLDHPNIVSTFDFATGTPTYLVMELLSGASLRELIRRVGPIPVQRARAILAQLLGALSVAHRAGIVHRDIKPDNVFVCPLPNGELVKLLDFDIARSVAPDVTKLTVTGTLLGTASYLAPEVARGEHADAQSDLYSVGATAYCMLSGRRPFEGKSGADVLMAAIRETPAPLATLCPYLDAATVAFVERLMAKDKAQRFASADAALAALMQPWREPAASSSRLALGIAVGAAAFFVSLAATFYALHHHQKVASASHPDAAVAVVASASERVDDPAIAPLTMASSSEVVPTTSATSPAPRAAVDVGAALASAQRALDRRDAGECLRALSSLETVTLSESDDVRYGRLRVQCTMARGPCERGREVARTVYAKRPPPAGVAAATARDAAALCSAGELTPEETLIHADTFFQADWRARSPASIDAELAAMRSAADRVSTATEPGSTLVARARTNAASAASYFGARGDCTRARSAFEFAYPGQPLTVSQELKKLQPCAAQAAPQLTFP